MKRTLPMMMAAPIIIAATTAACSTPATTANSGDNNQIVLSGADELGEFSPLAGYSANGVSPIYEGLLRPAALDENIPADGAMPDLEPRLAAEAPEVSDGGRTWTVKLQGDVLFHDGSGLDSSDVAATYRAVMDPRTASPVAADYQVIDHIDTPDEKTVVFHLTEPIQQFESRLLLGIAPAERIGEGTATESSLNTDPVGTGPYRLEQLDPTEATLLAFDDYHGQKPQVKSLVVRSAPDENSRSQQLLSGETDGTNLPPHLAGPLADNNDELTLTAVKSADWRGLSLPANAPATSDRALRTAMNLAVDRNAIVDKVLAGYGTPVATPFAPAYRLDPASFAANPGTADPEAAQRLLESNGWARGDDGIWEKNGVRAEFTLAYNADDSTRRELSTAFADQMRDFGVEVTPWGASWDDIEARADDVAILLGGGDNPYTLDTQAYRTLHSREETTGVLDNPGGYSNPAVDAALEEARVADPNDMTAWNKAQDAYIDDPGYVFLAVLDHTYLSRDTGFAGPDPIMEPHAHGVMWGPWWSLAEWTR